METMYLGGSIAIVIAAITLLSKLVVNHGVTKKKDAEK